MVVLNMKMKLLNITHELKALEGTCEKIEVFPPGQYMSSKDFKYKKWYNRDLNLLEKYLLLLNK